jgi:aconitate hydratase
MPKPRSNHEPRAKILSAHLVSGELKPGTEIGIRIDQTLTQDATGTMSYLQFEAIGIPRVKTDLSVSYVDHNMLQTASRTPMTIAIFRAWRPSMAFTSPGRQRHLPPGASGALW